MTWLIESALGAALLAVVVWAGVRVFAPRPAVAHALWLLVVLKLVTPPVVRWSAIPGAWAAPVVEISFAAERDAAWPSHTENPVAGLGAARPQPAAADTPWVGSTPGAETSSTAWIQASPLYAPEVPGTGHRSPHPIPWGAVLLAIWSVGAALMVVRLALGARRIRRLLDTAQPASATLTASLGVVARRIGVRPPRTLLVRGIHSPFVWGIGRPILCWPEAWAQGYHATESVLAHELAHLRRRDHWVAQFEVVAAVALWWNPLFWWARGHMREHAELACDAWALWAVPSGRRAYATALIDSAERECSTPALAALGARPRSREAFEKRLLMILHSKTPRRLSLWSAVPLGIASLALLAGPAFSQDPSERREDVRRRITQAVDRLDVPQDPERTQDPKPGARIEIRVNGVDLSTLSPEARRDLLGELGGAGTALGKLLQDPRPAPAPRTPPIAGFVEQMLSELSAELAEDEDVQRLGIAGDIEALARGVLSGEKVDERVLPNLIQKAVSGALDEARSEIRQDPDLVELGIADAIDGLVGSLLSEQGAALHPALEGLIGQAVHGILDEVRTELRDDEDLRALGLSDQVESMIGALLNDDPQLNRSVRQALDQVREVQKQVRDAHTPPVRVRHQGLPPAEPRPGERAPQDHDLTRALEEARAELRAAQRQLDELQRELDRQRRDRRR